MKKFLYLKEEWMADTWVSGGVVPLCVASTYRKSERKGTATPDENLQSTVDEDVRELPFYSDHMNLKNVIVIGGSKPITFIEGSRWIEDGLVFCLSNALPTWRTMKRFDKKCCVCIEDVSALKNLLDTQIGVISESGDCAYTWGHRKNHFLKSCEDRWMAEHRFFWRGCVGANVHLPSGVATRVPLWEGMWDTGTFFR